MTDPAKPLAPDNRNAPRKRALRAGRVLWSNRCAAMDCIIRDVSETGARVRLSDPVPLPQQVELLFVNENRIATAEVRWNRGNDYGLHFTGPNRPAG